MNLVNAAFRRQFDKANEISVYEWLLFGRLERFFEKSYRQTNVMRVVKSLCGTNTNARDFVKKVSYDDFKKQRGITEISALGLKMFLLFDCGVDWENPNSIVIAG